MIFLLVYIAAVVSLILVLVGIIAFGQLEKIDSMVESLVNSRIQEGYRKLDPNQMN